MSKINPYVKKFKGIVNNADPMGIGWSALKEAVNMDISNNGHLQVRDGYKKVLAGDFHSPYTNQARDKMFVVKDDFLCVYGKSTGYQMKQLFKVVGNVYYAQLNQDVYVNDGETFGYVNKDNQFISLMDEPALPPKLSATEGSLEPGLYQVACTTTLADGREGPCFHSASIEIAEGQALQMDAIPVVDGRDTLVYICPANSTVYQLAFVSPGEQAIWNGSVNDLGIELSGFNKQCLPKECSYITFHKGRLYAAYNNKENSSCTIFYSDALTPHVFSLSSDFFNLDGDCTVLCDAGSAVLLGTEHSIYSWNEEVLNQEADFGATHGNACSRETIANNSVKVLLWTSRGLCSAFPIQMLTDSTISVEKADFAYGGIVEKDGGKRFIASIKYQGKPFNKYYGD